MAWPRLFLSVLKMSFTRPLYYACLLRASFRFSFKFFWTYFLVGALVQSLLFLAGIITTQNALPAVGWPEKPAGTLSLITPLTVMTVFFGLGIFSALQQLLYLIFFAPAIWLLAKIFALPLSFGKSYQLGLHLSIIPATLLAIIRIWYLPITQALFLRTLVMLPLTLFILYKIGPVFYT